MIKNTSSQEIKTKLLLKIIEILLPFGNHNKNLLKYSEYYVVENVLHIMHVLLKISYQCGNVLVASFWPVEEIPSAMEELKCLKFEDKTKHMEKGEKFKV